MLGFAEEVDKLGVDLFGVSPGNVVRAVLDGNEARAFDELGSFCAGRVDGDDTVGIAVDDKSWDVDFSHVVAEIFVPSGNAGEAGGGGSDACDAEAGLNGLFADAFAEQNVGVVEILEKFGEEGVAVGRDGSLNAFEDGLVDAVGVVGSLEQIGRNAANDDGPVDALGAVLADVASDFAASIEKPTREKLVRLRWVMSARRSSAKVS